MQGDIVEIYSSAGVKLISYSYDAWGNTTISYSNSGASTTAVKNNLTYRGYYYDRNLNLYYLQSRYYDAKICRFISPDSLMSGTNGSLHGFNLYVYCFNNPISYTDSEGNWPEWVKKSIKWVAKNVFMPTVETIEEALSNIDMTYSAGLNISGTPSAFLFNAQGGIAIDTKGNVAIQGAAGGNFTTGSPGTAATYYQSVTNAPSIDNLLGTGYQIGGSAGVPVNGIPFSFGADFNIIPSDKTYYGATINAGLGTPGGEIHAGLSYTGELKGSRFNVFDVAERMYIRIMGW